MGAHTLGLFFCKLIIQVLAGSLRSPAMLGLSSNKVRVFAFFHKIDAFFTVLLKPGKGSGGLIDLSNY